MMSMKVSGRISAAEILFFQAFQFADRHLIGDSLLRLRLCQFLDVFPALDPSHNLDMLAHFECRRESCISAPADAWYVV